MPPTNSADKEVGLAGWKLWVAVGVGSLILVIVFAMVVWTLHRRRHHRGRGMFYALDKESRLFVECHVTYLFVGSPVLVWIEANM